MILTGAVRALLARANWQLMIGALLAIFTVVSYILTRRRELAWRRTEFLCRQSEYLDSDFVLVEMITILEERHPHITIDSILEGTDSLGSAMRQDQKLDKLLNMLWRLCYAHLETRTISINELNGFGWDLMLISESSALTQYCDDNGFEEINIAIKRLKRIW